MTLDVLFKKVFGCDEILFVPPNNYGWRFYSVDLNMRVGRFERDILYVTLDKNLVITDPEGKNIRIFRTCVVWREDKSILCVSEVLDSEATP